MDFLKKRLPRNDLILEAGCGTGHLVLALQSLNYNIVGVDNIPETLETAKQFSEKLNLVCGDLAHLSMFKDKEFNTYLSIGVLEHYEDKRVVEAIINEAKRVTKDVIFISLPYLSPNLYKRYASDRLNKDLVNQYFYQYYFTKTGFTKLLHYDLSLQPFEYVYYATDVGLKRNNRYFKFFFDHFKIFRFFVKKCRRILNYLFGKKYGHMIGAWCKFE